MSISVNVKRAESDYNRAYSAGKQSMIDESKIIEKTASGKQSAFVDDVSELPHDIAVQLSSDTVTDFSGITLKRYGANLLPAKQAYAVAPQYTEVVEDGRECVRFEDHATKENYAFPFLENTRYTATINYKVVPKPVHDDGTIRGSNVFAFFYSDGTKTYINANNDKKWKTARLTSTAGKTVVAVGTTSVEYRNYVYIDINGFQLQQGTQTIDVEPYIEPTQYTLGVDGSVRVKSLSPCVTLIADNPDVNVSVTYHKSFGMQAEYNRFWNSYQDYGERTNYSLYAGAFGGAYWTDELFKPKYAMQPKSAEMMFRATGITDLTREDIVLDFSKATAMQYAFAFSNTLVKLPVIDMTSATNCTSTFSYFKGTELSIIVSEATKLAPSTFDYVENLINLTIVGKVATTTGLSRATKLSKPSIESIVNALSTTTSGLTVTLSKTAVDTAFATTEGGTDGSTSAEWLALVATRSNWTIALA